MNTKALNIYHSLDHEQKGFVDEKKIQKYYKAKKWLELFEKIAEMDRYSDEFRNKNLKYMIGLGVLIFLSIIFGSSFFIGNVITGFLILFFIILYIYHKKHNKIDIENSFRLSILPLLSILKEEIDKDNKIYLAIDCSSQFDEKKVLKVIPPQSSSLPYFTTTFYKNPWFYLEATLGDGTLISMSFDDLIRKKSITKRGSRGKIKSKEKYKIAHKIKISLQFPKNNFSLVSKQDNSIQENETYYEYRGVEKLISYDPEDHIDLNFPLLAIAKGYKNFHRIGQ